MKLEDLVPFVMDGYCQCGCGQKTSIITKNDKHSGLIKGQHRRYVNFHCHLPRLRLRVICNTCGMVFERSTSEMKGKRGKYCSTECFRNREKTGGYASVHKWLKKHFGIANRCENPMCTHKSKRFHWALKGGYKHEHKRENYLRLCVGCHSRYDITEERINKLRRQNPYPKGSRHTQEQIERIRESVKRTMAMNLGGRL